MADLRDDVADSITYHPTNRNSDFDAKEKIAYMLADAVLPVFRAHLEAVLTDETTVEAVGDAVADYTPWGPADNISRAVLAALLPRLVGGTE